MGKRVLARDSTGQVDCCARTEKDDRIIWLVFGGTMDLDDSARCTIEVTIEPVEWQDIPD